MSVLLPYFENTMYNVHIICRNRGKTTLDIFNNLKNKIPWDFFHELRNRLKDGMNHLGDKCSDIPILDKIHKFFSHIFYSCHDFIVNLTPQQKKAFKNFAMEYMYLPGLILYMELIFHIYMKLSIKYLLVWVGFSIASGFFLETLTRCFSDKGRLIGRGVVTLLISVLYCVEMICKDILQQYFQLFSSMETAAGNHLTDYLAAIGSSMRGNWFGFILMLLIPGIACSIMLVQMSHQLNMRNKRNIRRRKKINTARMKQKKRLQLAILAVICLILHFIPVGLVKIFPWRGDITPKNLYSSDTYPDDQVEQLGLMTMLRLDGKHSIFGTSGDTGISDKELEKLAAEENKKAAKMKPNTMNIDFQKLIDEAPNDDVKWLSQYFQAAAPSYKNEYTGMFKDYNVIFITAEGFTGYAIDKELTPTLYKLTHEGFQFKNFYSALHFTSTSGGEFQNLIGLYPKNGSPISMTETGKQGTDLPFTLAHELNKKNYTSIGFHFNENMYGRELSHPNLGYDWRQASKCENPIEKEALESGSKIWPQSDDYMIEQSIDTYIDKQPFNIYYLTLSGHMPYGWSDNMISKRNKDAVAELPYSEKTKAYLAATLELEKGLTRLITSLEEAGIADKTVIAMAPDHIPYFDVDTIAELSGKNFGTNSLENLNEKTLDFDVYKNSFILWSASMDKKVTIDKPCCQVDILPTMLNLLGIKYDSRLLGGTDILSDSEPLVVFSSRSWLTDKGIYNRYTGKFTPAKGVEMSEAETEEYVSRMKTLASCRLQITPMIIENDYYSLLSTK